MILIKEKTLEKYTFIDLFAGLGGFRLALESLGAKCVYSSEWDNSVREVYTENFKDIPEGDITKIDENSIPDHDILCAGFPCQAFSISGKRRGFEDTRGTLFFDVARIVKAKKPKVVFLENVKGLLSHDKGKTFTTIKDILENDLGYKLFYKVLNACDYGIPQHRERIYIVCFRKDLEIENFKFPKPVKLKLHVEDFLLKGKEIENLYTNRPDIHYNGVEDDKYSNKPVRLGFVNKGGQGERIYSTKGVTITFSAYGGGVFAKTGGYLIDGKIRKLHPRECARLMGYPDSFKICKSSSQAYKQFGNSVVIDVLQYIAIEIGKVLFP